MSRCKLLIVLVGVFASFNVGGASGQQPGRHGASFNFYQRADDSGAINYTADFHHAWPIGSPAVERKLIAPNGTEFVSPAGQMFSGTFNFSATSFAELGAFSFGDWTVIEEYSIPLSYQVRVAPFSLGDVFVDIPIITSPVPSSNVPFDFFVDWTYLNGGTPNNKRHGTTSRNVRVGVNDTGDLQRYQLHADTAFPTYAPSLPRTIEMTVGSETPLPAPQLVGDPIPGDEFTFAAKFFTFSAAATYTVVPEPSTLLLALAAIGGLLTIRRR